MMYKLRSIVFVLILMAVAGVPVSGFAEPYFTAPYNGYIYDGWGASVPAPDGYIPGKVYLGEDIGCGQMVKPQDIFIDPGGNIYVLDSGNGRIVVLDKSFVLKKTIDKFTYENKEEKLNMPEGLFVTGDGVIYIADTGNRRVLISDQEGEVSGIINKPQSEILPAGYDFAPSKLAVDELDTVYVIDRNNYRGMLLFDRNGSFAGFYGSNQVKLTLDVLTNLFWKKLLSKEQQAGLTANVPVQYSNLFMGKDGFIYASVKYSDSSDNEIKKLNPKGLNALKPVELQSGSSSFSNHYTFGDLETGNYLYVSNRTKLTDVGVDGNGFISALDEERGRIFVYDNECNNLFIFGGKGDQVGTFKSPVAVDVYGDEIIVLDSERGSITTFRITQFGRLVKEAVKLYNDGLYEEALGNWTEVLKYDNNYRLAFIGMGKAKKLQGKLDEAVKYFKLGNDRVNYSIAYKQFRSDYIRSHFTTYMSIILAAVIILFTFRSIRKGKLSHIIENSRRKAGER